MTSNDDRPTDDQAADRAQWEPDAPLGAPLDAVTVSGRTAGPSRLRVGLIGGAAMALVVGGVATSLAASPSPSAPSTPAANGAAAPDTSADGSIELDRGRQGAKGFRNVTIAAISGSDVTLGTEDGWRRTITVTNAIELTKGGQAIALSDLKVGDQIRFAQTRNADGTYTVTKLSVVVPTVGGTVSDVSSTAFKVTTRDGSVWTVTVNASTTYKFGTADGSLADVKAGEKAVVAGTTTGDNALTALSVRVAGDRAMGTVSAKTASSITITTRDGSKVTVHVDSDTTYRVAGTETATLADVTVDMKIAVSGRSRADGSVDADAVLAGNLRGFGRGGFDRPKPGSEGDGTQGSDVELAPLLEEGDAPIL